MKSKLHSETWLHVCPIHGEEQCNAERADKEQVHTCNKQPETHFWKGKSYRKENLDKVILEKRSLAIL